MLAALAAKFAVEGPQTMPTYCPKRGKTSLLCFFLAFVVFPLPEIFPRLYWLSHSLWHCLIGAGYYILYSELLDEQRQSKAKKLPRRPRVMLHATAAEGGSDRAKAA